MSLDVGTRAPEFSLVSQDRHRISLSDLSGKRSMIVFVPYPFTSVCDAEMCNIRDTWDVYEKSDTHVVVITCHAVSTNTAWAKANDYRFPILADYWPHGAVARAYDAFDERWGYSKRATYVLDGEGVIQEVIVSEILDEARPFDQYPKAVGAV